jgi:hypothetical protein
MQHATSLEIGLTQRERLAAPKPSTPHHDDQAAQAKPVAVLARLAHQP